MEVMTECACEEAPLLDQSYFAQSGDGEATRTPGWISYVAILFFETGMKEPGLAARRKLHAL